MITGSFDKIKPLHLCAKQGRKTFGHRKQCVLRGDWLQGQPRASFSCGVSYTAVSSELADLGYRKFNAKCRWLPNPPIPDLLRTGTLMNSIL